MGPHVAKAAKKPIATDSGGEAEPLTPRVVHGYSALPHPWCLQKTVFLHSGVFFSSFIEYNRQIKSQIIKVYNVVP